MSMAMAASGGDREHRIREIAYLIWQEEGCPHGRDREHWLKACERVAIEEARPTATPPKPAKPKAAVAARPKKAPAKR